MKLIECAEGLMPTKGQRVLWFNGSNFQKVTAIGKSYDPEMFKDCYWMPIDESEDAAEPAVANRLDKWIKCTMESMPPQGPIFWFFENSVLPDMLLYPMCYSDRYKDAYWMPRFVPEPPVVEEESKLVKALICTIQAELETILSPGTCKAIADTVKRTEKEANG